MKFSTIVFCGLIVAGSALPALAAPFERGLGFRPMVQDQRPSQRPRPGREREAERPAPRRDMRGSGEGERGRMNPEDRRQLRRDIQDAGKDIYRAPRDRREDPRRSGRR